jgi:hypothetical protein
VNVTISAPRFAAAAQLGVAAVAACLATAALAQKPTSDPAIVPLFAETCLDGELSLAAREAAIAAAGWESIPADELKVRRFEAANPNNIDFSKPETVRQWKRMVGGKEVRAVLATFRMRGAYPVLCGVLVPDVENAFPYWDGFRDAIRAKGLKGKSIDLPHFQEFSGRLADGRRSRASLFSRTQVLPGARRMMHMFIAF